MLASDFLIYNNFVLLFLLINLLAFCVVFVGEWKGCVCFVGVFILVITYHTSIFIVY